jgi:hypothetical protein
MVALIAPIHTSGGNMSKPLAVPTIAQVLDSTPKDSGDEYADRLITYATLMWHWDGVDRKSASPRTIRKLIKQMDDWATDQIAGVMPNMVDEDDRVGLQVGDVTYWLACPSISRMPKRVPQATDYYRNIITQLADNPEAWMELPYLYYLQVTECIGKVMGFL